MSVSRSVQIEAPADAVWDRVSDLPRMGRLSPENVGGAWRGGATGPATGARFTGRNRNGWRRWSTTARVTRCDPGSAFSFTVGYLGIPVSEWAYEVTQEGTGCRVTESWGDHRPAWFKVVSGMATGIRQRDDVTTARNLESTLAALKALAEAGP
jgi:hypothetical protein